MIVSQAPSGGNVTVDQAGASSGHDMVGRDKITNVLPAPLKLSKLEKLKLRLQQEVDAGRCSMEVIDELQRFKKKVPDDGVSGLEAKLEVAGRSDQLIPALEMKEAFAKLLEKWSLYGSAQEIFAHLLAMADYKYQIQILPQLSNIGDVEVDELIEEKIVIPAIEDLGIDVFSMDHHSAMGMVYWLAEQCRVRWHK